VHKKEKRDFEGNWPRVLTEPQSSDTALTG